MRLFQYWDTGDPPDDVAAWVESFRSLNPEMRHRLFSRDDAAWFIKKHLGDRELRAFDVCAVPAMQADYFRLCAMFAKGGVYSDADYFCLKPLNELAALTPKSLVALLDDQFMNSFLLCRTAGNPYLGACLDLATLNIEERRVSSPFTATGPGVLNAIRVLLDPAAAPGVLAAYDNAICSEWGFPETITLARAAIAVTATLREAFAAMTVMPFGQLRSWIGRGYPAYQRTAVHWRNWDGSIYADTTRQA